MTVTAPPQMPTDTYVWPAMLRLAECLCTELVASGLPPTCLCSVLPGEVVATDYVTEDEGMAWVRLVSAYPYTTFPVADTTTASCVRPLAFELEVGALWCAPVFADSRGTPPDMGSQFAATEIQMAAMAAMHRAIVCCVPAERATAALGTYTPVGPEGQVVGGVWSLYVAGGVVR